MTSNRDRPVRRRLLAIEALDRVGIRYTVGGSLASSFSGEPHASIDVDIFDRDYLNATATVVGVGDLLEHVCREAGADTA